MKPGGVTPSIGDASFGFASLGEWIEYVKSEFLRYAAKFAFAGLNPLVDRARKGGASRTIPAY